MALLAATSQSQAQSCQRTEHLGTLRSYQTIERTGLLSAASTCRFNGVQYYDYYDFELSGAGEVTVGMSAVDFVPQIVLNTGAGEFLAGERLRWKSGSLKRTLPAGQYKVLAISEGSQDAGSYTLSIKTGQLAAPPPPPPPETTTDADQDDERVPPPDNTEVAEVVRGYVLARVHPLPENDRRGAYRVEFGFLSEEVLASGSDRTAVVEANEHLLPPRRYLNEASMLERARDNNRRWLHSSPIDVFPLEGDDATLSGEPLLTGRVIARWNPTSGGRFRIEFGFLPEEAIEAAGGDTQKAAEACADLLPDPGRYLSESRINSEARRSAPRWLTSSLVEIGECEGNGNGPVTITPIAVPLTLPRGEAISDESIAIIRGDLGETFTPVTVTGLPPGLEWDLAETSADGREHQLTVSGTISSSAAARDYSVQITAEGADGERTPETIRIEIPPGTTIVITPWSGYTPATTSVGGSVRIIQPRVREPIPPPPSSSITWEFTTRTTNICSVDRTTGALTLLAVGTCQVRVTASAAGYGDGTASAQVTVSPDPIPVISWSGYARNSVEFGDAALTLVRPTATVNGRPIDPDFRYSVAPVSATVCSVNEAIGALTIKAAGTCTINLTNLPGPGYGVGSADPVTVTVNPGDPGLRWSGYSPAMVQSRDSTPRLLPATAVARTIEFSYRSLTPSVCSATQAGALTLDAEDGTCIVQVTTSGDANYRSASTTATVTIRSVPPPEITISCSSPSIDEGESVTCSVTSNRGGEIDDYLWSAAGGSPSSGSSSTYSPSFSREGRYTVMLTASNDNGNGRDDDSTTVEVRPVPPPEIGCSPSQPKVGETVTCAAQSSRGRWTEYSWSASGGSPSSSSSTTYQPRFSREGRYTVTLTVRSSSGSEKRARPTTVEVIEEPPKITISCSRSLIEEGESVTCWVSSNSGGEIARYSWSASGGSPSSSSSSTYSPSFSRKGTYTVSLTARNDGGDGRDSTTVTVERGEEPPQVRVQCPPSAEENERIECTYTLTDGDRATRWSWSDSDGGSGRSSSYSVRFSSPGTKTVYLVAGNGGGDGRRGQDTVTVVRTPPPPDITVRCSPSSIDAGGSVTCEVSNRGGAITTYEWRARDGSPNRGSSSTYSPSFSQVGQHTVTLTARNAAGHDDDDDTVTVERGVKPPVGNISCIVSVTEVGESIRCGWNWTGGDRPTSLVWSGGDSHSGNSAELYYPSFSSPGTKTVSLRVSNAGGSARAEVTVRVVPPPPSTQYGRCGSDRIRVYYFERWSYTKRWLNMTWDEVAARVSGWGEHMIGHMSQTNCNLWPNGTNLTTSNWPPRP